MNHRDYLMGKGDYNRMHEHWRIWHGNHVCRVCDSTQDNVGNNPDVYFRGSYFDPYISHPDVPGHEMGSWIETKKQKAGLMKQFNLSESGDAHHGSRKFDPIAHRHAMKSMMR